MIFSLKEALLTNFETIFDNYGMICNGRAVKKEPCAP